MFNLYRYLLLFITNLSLAITIFSCSDFSEPGGYLLNNAIINDDHVSNIEINITAPAKILATEPTDDGIRSDYVLEGTIVTNQIKFKYCIDLKSVGIPEIFLTNDLVQVNVSSKINITDSEIITYNPPTVSLPEEFNTIDTYESGKVPMLDRDITKNNISAIPMGSSVHYGEDEKHGTKREWSDGSYSNRESKHHKNDAHPDIIDCSTLKPGRYKIQDKEDVNIVIISSVYNAVWEHYTIDGFLTYSNFFSVPIYRCKTDGENLIFSVARRLTKISRDRSDFKHTNTIEYKVPKIKFIDKNFTKDKGSYDRFSYQDDHFNIGCSILSEGFSLNKKTFNIKENVKINISSISVSTQKKTRKSTYRFRGIITIDGLSYKIYNCERDYANNNDSKINYIKDKSFSFYLFNILDLLPSLTS